MCGICGIANTFEEEKRRVVVQQMNEAILHRGPDEAGFLSTPFCTLAMRRLAIIDLTGGTQPIYNESRSVCVFLNGEIYNYKELRKTLEKKGHIFTTSSDTETLVHLYEEFGQEMTTRLKGMFTFCIYDLREEVLFIGRDRFGEKPLYYHHNGKGFSFSSEVKSLLENDDIPRVLNEEALPYYLSLGVVPEPLTLLKDIYSLPPGHTLLFRHHRVIIEKYFEVNYKPDERLRSKEEVMEYLNPILNKAVKRQMISDVPIGAFLSGGIDSSTIVAKMQQQSSEPIKTFTVKFEDSKYDESPVAKAVSEHLGTDHYQITIPNYDFDEDLFWMIIDHNGLPFTDSSAIPTYLITKEIKKHVTVALSGDGGDELFAGYNVFKWWSKITRIHQLPRVVKRLISGSAEMVSQLSSFENSTTLRQVKRATQVASYSESFMPIVFHQMFTDKEVGKLFWNASPVEKNNLQRLAEYPKAASGWSSLRKVMYYRVMHNLPLHMLPKVDRMSMANSLEVRAPFLDPDLFEASTRIPDRFLIHDGIGKYILREMVKDQLPDIVFNHPKTGFDIPLQKYFNTKFKNLIKSLVNEGHPLAQLFDIRTIEKWIELGTKQRKDNKTHSIYRTTHQIWLIIQLFGWAKRFKVKIVA